MSKVVHIVQKMSPGGIESVVLDLASMNPDIIVCSLEGTAQDLIADWPPAARLGSRLATLSKGSGFRPAAIMHLAAMLCRLRPDVVVTHHIGPLLYGGIASRLAGLPRVIHVEHDAWHLADPKRRRLARVLQRLIKPRRVAVSGMVADQVVAALGQVGQIVIPNGVDLGRFAKGDKIRARRLFGLPEDAKVIGSVGRLEFVKGHDQLIEALSRLPEGVHAAIAGTGSASNQLRRIAQDLQIEHRIHFLGGINSPEHLYPAFDVFCLPSRAEGFPRAVIEAQASDLPVVAFDVGGVREATCPQTCALIDAGNIEGLAAALAACLAAPPAGSPRKFVEPRFSNQLMADRYHAVASF